MEITKDPKIEQKDESVSQTVSSNSRNANFDADSVITWIKKLGSLLGRLWKWSAYAIGSLFLGIILIFVLLGLFSGSGTSSKGVNETYRYGSGIDKIAIIPIEGIIGDTSSGVFGESIGITEDSIKTSLNQAADDPLVKGVVLKINSPGGSAVVSDQIYQAVVDFKNESKKYVVASFGDTAASGGYYIGAAADKIVANPATITGSIGVIMEFYNASGLLDTLGVSPEVVKSGPYKDIGSLSREATDSERAILQSVVDDAFVQFVDRVVEGRKMEREKVEELADGRIYTGSQASENGLIDELGNLETAVDLVESLASISDATVVEYDSRNWFDSFLGISQKLQPLSALQRIAPESTMMGLQYRWYP